MSQLNFDDWAKEHARRENPATSKAAAISMAGAQAEQCREILGVLEAASQPLNAEQIADRCSLDKVQVGRRLSDLRDRLQLAEEAEGITAPTRSGRQAQCWRVKT